MREAAVTTTLAVAAGVVVTVMVTLRWRGVDAKGDLVKATQRTQREKEKERGVDEGGVDSGAERKLPWDLEHEESGVAATVQVCVQATEHGGASHHQRAKSSHLPPLRLNSMPSLSPMFSKHFSPLLSFPLSFFRVFPSFRSHRLGQQLAPVVSTTSRPLLLS